MELSTMAAAAKLDTQTASDMAATQREQARGQQFAQLLQAEPLRENFYVDSPASGGAHGNPVSAFVSKFEEMDFAAAAMRRGEELARAPIQAGSPGSEYSLAAREAVYAQGEIVRTVIMMETVNTAKQGVSTLFQQQG
ncbi:MAG: hypothetical protein H0W48_04050 [Methylibium sp.]|nr:hypothetical protein [Methylibium sp.]